MKPIELYEQAREALTLHDFEEAKRYSDALVEIVPGHIGARILAGTIAMKRSRYAEAAEAFEKAFELDPDLVEALNNLGVALKHTGDIDGALEVLYQAEGKESERGDVCYNIGNCLKEQGNQEEALRYYQKAIDHAPDAVLAYNNLGTIYQNSGDYDKAIEIFQKGLARDDNHPTLRYNLGLALEAQGKYEDAVAQYKRSVKSHPGWIQGLNNLGVALEKNGKLDEAEQTFRDLLRINPEDPKGNNNLGTVLNRKGEREDAEKYYRKAFAVDQNYAKAAANLTSMKSENLKRADSLAGIEEIASQFPENPEVQIKLAAAYIKTGKVNKAGLILAPLLKRDQTNSEAHLLTGRIRKQQGKSSLAEKHFNLALKHDPAFAEPHLYLALLARDQGETEKAMGEVSRYIEIKGSSLEGSLLLAELLVRQNLYREAVELYEELEQHYPGEERISRGLAHCYRMLGEHGKAIRITENLAESAGAEEEELERLLENLEMHGTMTEEYAEKHQELWQKNLLALAEGESALSVDENQQMEAESIIDESLPDFGEEEVPIIDVGGIEPAIAVDEEEDDISLEEMEEDLFLPDEQDEEEEEPKEKTEAVAAAAAGDGGGTGGAAAAGDGAGAGGGGRNPIPSGTGASYPPPISHHYFSGDIHSSQYGNREIKVTQVKREKPLSPKQPPPLPPEPSPEPPPEPLPEADSAPEPLTEPEPIEELTSPQDAESTGEENSKKTDAPEPEKPADLLTYLESLTKFLPEDPRREFETSDMPLRMESLRAKLEGKPGFFKRFMERSKEEGAESEKGAGKEKKAEIPVSNVNLMGKEPLKRDRVKSSFSFLEGLTDYLPASEIRVALRDRIHRILNKMNGESE